MGGIFGKWPLVNIIRGELKKEDGPATPQLYPFSAIKGVLGGSLSSVSGGTRK